MRRVRSVGEAGEALVDTGPRRPPEVDPGPHRRHCEALHVVQASGPAARFHGRRRTATSPATLDHSSAIEVCSPVPTLITSPLPRLADRTSASTTSSMNTKSRVWRPSPCITGPRPLTRSIDERCDDTAGRTLTRSVDTAERQRGELDRMQVAIRHEQVDDRSCDDAADTARFELRRLAFLDRQRLRRRIPVDRRRRNGDDDLRDAVAPRRLERGERREERTRPGPPAPSRGGAAGRAGRSRPVA